MNLGSPVRPAHRGRDDPLRGDPHQADLAYLGVAVLLLCAACLIGKT